MVQCSKECSHLYTCSGILVIVEWMRFSVVVLIGFSMYMWFYLNYTDNIFLYIQVFLLTCIVRYYAYIYELMIKILSHSLILHIPHHLPPLFSYSFIKTLPLLVHALFLTLLLQLILNPPFSSYFLLLVVVVFTLPPPPPPSSTSYWATRYTNV